MRMWAGVYAIALLLLLVGCGNDLPASDPTASATATPAGDATPTSEASALASPSPGTASTSEAALGSEPIELTIGDAIDLPRDIALIVEPACFACEDFPTGLRRVYVDPGGHLRSDQLAGPTGSGARLEGNMVNFTASNDGESLAASVCLQGGCGSLQYPTADALTAIYASGDGGVSWHRLTTIAGGAWVLAALRGKVTVERDGPPYTYSVYPGDIGITVPNLAVPGTAFESSGRERLLWHEEGDHALVDSTGDTVVRLSDSEVVESFLPALDSTRAANAYTSDVRGDPSSQHYLRIDRGDASTAPLQFNGYIGLGGWFADRQIVANVASTETVGTPLRFLTGVIDYDAHTFHPFRDVLASTKVEYVISVVHGPFARVVALGDCVNIRAEADGRAAVLTCAADGVLLHDLREERQVGEDTWVHVESPDGLRGWASASYLERGGQA